MSKFNFEESKKKFNENNDLMEMILELSYEKTKNLKYKAMLLENKIHGKICNFIEIEDDDLKEELAYTVNILEQLDKSVDDIIEKGNLGKDD